VTRLTDLRHAPEAIDRVLAENEPVKRGAWRTESVDSHVAHAVAHLQVWRGEWRLEDVEHALVRVALAAEMLLREADATAEPAR
jgi:hypothetical protein